MVYKFDVGDLVEKVMGYPFPGKVIMRGLTDAGQDRYVVECSAHAVRGCLHIFNPVQLKRR